MWRGGWHRKAGGLGTGEALSILLQFSPLQLELGIKIRLVLIQPMERCMKCVYCGVQSTLRYSSVVRELVARPLLFGTAPWRLVHTYAAPTTPRTHTTTQPQIGRAQGGAEESSRVHLIDHDAGVGSLWVVGGRASALLTFALAQYGFATGTRICISIPVTHMLTRAGAL